MLGRQVRFIVHVRFFGPKGLSSWITPAHHVQFDPLDIAEDLRDGSRVLSRSISDKIFAELNWAIEDAQIVANEQDWKKRGDVFDEIIQEQFK